MWFDGWHGILRTVVIGLLAYAAPVLLLRVSGNRTLAKLNAFDLIMTVALGSVLSTMLLNTSVALVYSLIAVGLQFLVARVSVRHRWFSRLVTAEPVLLLHRGRFLEVAMRRPRVTRSDVLAVLRASGVSTPEKVAAMVIKADGSMSVIKDAGPGGAIGILPAIVGA